MRSASSACCPRRGAHGFVQRAIDMMTGEEVAVKFIERGRKWKPKHLLRCAPASSP